MEGLKLLREAKVLFAFGCLEKSVNSFTKAEKLGCDVTGICISRGAAEMALGRYVDAEGVIGEG